LSFTAKWDYHVTDYKHCILSPDNNDRFFLSRESLQGQRMFVIAPSTTAMQLPSTTNPTIEMDIFLNQTASAVDAV
jgi:hypothetical protein